MRPGEIPAAGLHAIAGFFLPLLIPLSWSGRPGGGSYAGGDPPGDGGRTPDLLVTGGNSPEAGVFRHRSWKGAGWI